ncbi:chromosome segregation protein sudA [Verticillium alfalfae VaMs.102]|uniref:Chromosome segregation protein sudA n=1 Tax=Verticillium alfalfae (strain VaMs.102 / ATCC MYA-4576 / FGSC 10136) TaxID=526221 RepID=C9SVH2_VERA1|nr:chromosome segregation protein sudA [Verticillium alfalfae VaMs.102]EEY22787.1 chromosome segregation protein sudA [Verticillium alfalfae VaMs.102]
MYIKQIIIQGFKSYKDQTVIEPFSPGTNVIVGRNGSGKSNFFAAIRFVLSDNYNQMSREERQGLLHEGSGSAVMSAYVEIIFDNSDDRFPTGGKELILRRTIGSKKDEYSLDRKVVTKNDVINLLEAAGFSRSNPYYIVPQGRVSALTNMKESDRLNLMKEVAGTQVYEARRAESLKIMNETNNKREKIDELLGYIKERLAELEEEKEELRGFQDKDRDRRCLEYALYYQEQQAFQSQLERIENMRQNGLESTEQIRNELKDAEKTIAKLDAEITKLTREMDLLKIDRRQLDEERRKTAKDKAVSELKVKNLFDGQSAAAQAQQQHDAELKAVRKEMADSKHELERITPVYDERRKKENEIRLQMDTAEAARTRLYNKQTRSSQFKNKAARDKWLRDEIEDLRTNIMSQKANKLTTAEDVARLLSRDEEKLRHMTETALHEKHDAENRLGHSMDGATKRGLATIRRLKREQDVPGAYGTLAELFEVNEAYRLAAEQIAGNSLFHYVVQDSRTSEFIIEQLNRQKGGRVTFMPLDQLRPRQVNLPRSQDAVPLLSKIRYDPKYEKAFQQVFGKVVVCRTLAIATQYARSHGVDAITPEGDQASKRGAMTGGYIEPGRSRLEAVHALNQTRDSHEHLQSQLEELGHRIEQKGQQITQAMGELQKAEQKLRHLQGGFDPLRNQLSSKHAYLEREKAHLEAAIKRREKVEKNMKDFTETLAAHEAELSSEFKKALSPAEERQLSELEKQVDQLQKEWNETSRQRGEVERRKQILEANISENLEQRLNQLISQEIENTVSGPSGNLKEAQRELKRLQKAADEVETKLQETETQIEQLSGKVARREVSKAENEQHLQEISVKEAKQRTLIEKSQSKKAVYSAQAADAAKAIRDLGVLPDDFSKYENLDSKQIDSRLKRVRNALKKYQHVNKKAFEQYNSFTSQQDQLLKRRSELDASQRSIKELIEHLDERKDEAIERTFKQVSKEFATIFEKLVPAGHGRLVIQRRTDKRQIDPESRDDYRTAVAALLQSISDEAGTQFICTTFRPEIVLVADKCYGVTFSNKASSIDVYSSEEALNFVDGEAKGR